MLVPVSPEETNAGGSGPESQGGIDASDQTLSEADRLRRKVESQLGTIQDLYRRLHIELDDLGRSGLIIELFEDPHRELRLLGFELADRDLSSNTVLSPQVGEAVKEMLDDDSAAIRARAARLVTRLAPPDAMIVLTEALGSEQDPQAAGPMLSGIARWPNPDAREPVLRWYGGNDAPLGELNAAGWSMAQAGLWDAERGSSDIIVERLRSAGARSLREPGMKLLARYGDLEDLRHLVEVLLEEEEPLSKWAAGALVETPRAVDLLLQAAEQNPSIFEPAAEALIKHRANPEGLRRLVGLAATPEQRARAVVRMGEAIDAERLAEAVRLAELPRDQAILLLKRLLTIDGAQTSRHARGVLLLAQMELDAARPNRALEAVITLDDSPLDPDQKVRADRIETLSLLLLGRFDEALATADDYEIWQTAIGLAGKEELGRKIAEFMLDSAMVLSEEQRQELVAIAGPTTASPNDG